MIDQFVGFCLHRRVAIIILAGLLAGYGVYAWETLSVEAYPELGDVAAQVSPIRCNSVCLRSSQHDLLIAAPRPRRFERLFIRSGGYMLVGIREGSSKRHYEATGCPSRATQMRSRPA